MIDITALVSCESKPLESIRYDKKCKAAVHGVSVDRGPVVAWNITKKCNFKCKHCYSESTGETDVAELSLSEIKDTIKQMKALKVPVVLLSGGEPLMHPHIFEIIEAVRKAGMRISLSTNGSLITKEVALRLKELGVSYVGISLDGIGAVNDHFRGVEGAFEAAVRGIRNCEGVGQKVGLRMTVHTENVYQVPEVLSFMETEGIKRICFYHLVPSGRGSDIKSQMMSAEQARSFVEDLLDYSLALKAGQIDKEILTVTNHTDGPFLYLLMKARDEALAACMLDKLSNNRGNRSGIAMMNMDWKGEVYPDQFSKFMPLGSIREKTLDEIWVKGSQPLTDLRRKRDLLNGVCKSCKWLEICGGNLRARAYMTSGDLWGMDPGCYLKDDEI